MIDYISMNYANVKDRIIELKFVCEKLTLKMCSCRIKCVNFTTCKGRMNQMFQKIIIEIYKIERKLT